MRSGVGAKGGRACRVGNFLYLVTRIACAISLRSGRSNDHDSTAVGSRRSCRRRSIRWWRMTSAAP
ncbi:protein of unknown function [Methylorubrum extorquens]|uniref:Uncharacterized protein n=1 Tax=Methylorubrum extorquens TaxID=408 RepID=A0A2N9ANL9_METEX|nr:protein of unknown function [Methylorubrum extorquens]